MWVCPVEPITEYVRCVESPDKTFIQMEGRDHTPQYTNPREFAENVKKVLKREYEP